MKFEHSPDYLEGLLAEQAEVQAGKCQTRLLENYNQYLFPGVTRNGEVSCAIGDFLEDFTRDGELSIAGILNGMYHAKLGNSVHWADMGGGHGLAMRQIPLIDDSRSNLRLTNVDLFDYGDELFMPDDLSYLGELNPAIFEPEAKPDLLMTDVQTVELETKADLITSIEVIQYLDDPINALCNWYNNLNDDGVMVVSQDPDLSQWIRFDKTTRTSENWSEWPTKYLLQDLARSSIRFAISNGLDWFPGQRKFDPEDFRTIAIQRKRGTTLRQNSTVTDIWVSPNDYKAVYYERKTPLIIVDGEA